MCEDLFETCAALFCIVVTLFISIGVGFKIIRKIAKEMFNP